MVCATILGLIWGSFVAALCSRWPKAESIIGGRSYCDSCNHTLAAFDLIPVISYALLRGKCRYCGGKIGADALAVELVAGAIGLASFIVLPAPQALAAAMFGWLLLPLIILDARHLWLPDRLIAVLALLGLVAGPMLTPEIAMTDRLIGAAAGYLALESIRRLYRAIRNREGMGAGDPKLFAALGIWLGWQSLPVILLLASVLGFIWALIVRFTNGRPPTELPLGSFLGAAAIIIAICA